MQKAITLKFTLCVGLLFSAAVWSEPNSPAPTVAGKNYVIVVSGINKDPDERQRKTRTVVRLHRYFTEHMKLGANHLKLLIDRNSFVPVRGEASTAANLRAALRQVSGRIGPGDRLIFYYVGQANIVGEQLRFNLPGPDITQLDLGQWLDEAIPPTYGESDDTGDPNWGHLGKHIIIIDCPGAGLALEVIRGGNRIVVCGARSDQPYSTRFSDFFVPALSEPLNDIDTDGRISLLEAFQTAVKQTDDLYLEQDLLKTENALLDDNGDGVPSQQPWRFREDGNDGRAAAACFLDLK